MGVVSDEAVSGLKTLVELSTASMVDRRGNKTLGAVYMCGSAYSAYNPALGVIVGSNCPVYYMPLPPLPVEKDDEKLMKVYSGEALAFACALLWSSQYNARYYGNVLWVLVGEQAKMLKEGQKICEMCHILTWKISPLKFPPFVCMYRVFHNQGKLFIN